MTLYLGANLISGVATPVEPSRNIGQIIPSAIPLTDAGLHLLDGTLILGNGIYSAFVDYIAGLVSTYPDLFVTEANWQTSVNTYGVCGKFVYTNEISATMPSVGTLTGTRNPSSDMDAGSLGMRYAWNVPELGGDIFTVSETPNVGDAIWVYQNGSWATSGVNIEAVNHSVRLPKITGIIEGTTDVTALGDLVEAGLPNITGTVGYFLIGNQGNTGYQSGAFANSTYSAHSGAHSYSDSRYSKDVVFDASLSSSLYKNNFNKVQPQTIKCYYYIVIATSTKTDIEVDIDEIATDLNSKADVDFSNVSNISGFRKLVEVYNNGASWYKVFSEYNPTDGTYIGLWCEQGGEVSNTTGGATLSVTFLKPFSNTNYELTRNQAQSGPNYSNTYSGYTIGYTTKTTTGFTFIGEATNFASSNIWRACGYIS